MDFFALDTKSTPSDMDKKNMYTNYFYIFSKKYLSKIFFYSIYKILLFYALSCGVWAQRCILISEEENYVAYEGDATLRVSPCSTFKIVLSLMGFEEGILKDGENPCWFFKKGYDDALPIWRQSQTPCTWMVRSCIWYSKLLALEIGFEKFNAYVKKIGYGNQDTMGDAGKNNGLTHCWLSSSLKISPAEQLIFLKKLVRLKLPFSRRAHLQTWNLLDLGMLDGTDWKLYGKTGSGHHEGKKHGWFIGWLEKENIRLFFVFCDLEEKPQEGYVSVRLKAYGLERLKALVSEYVKY